jgi:alanyl-tRNA synthetase
MMLFGEKYGDEVRVLDIGSSRELCGGTHVARTGDIGLFKIVGESGVAAGIRRIEAVAGTVALARVQAMEDDLQLVEGFYQARGPQLQAKLQQEREERRSLERQVAQMKAKMAASQGDDLASSAVDVKGVKILAAKLEGADVKTLRDTLDQLKNKLKSSAIVLAASDGDNKVSLIAGVTADLIAKVKAGELVNHVARQVGGKGGGRPDMAQAGGTDSKALPQALASVRDWVEERL